MGYNASDDGVVLAGAKRILQGEFPHRDFIQIRPFGSNYFWAVIIAILEKFHIPLIYWTRLLVWVQFFVISLIWVLLLVKPGNKIKLITLIPIVTLSAMISSHNFPIMPWTTIDGLFFISLGIYLYFRSKNKWIKFFGLFTLGSCFWFKQNYIFVFLLMLFYLIYIRHFFEVVFLSLFSIGSLSILLFNNAFYFFLEQLFSRGSSELIYYGFTVYLLKINSISNKIFTFSQTIFDPLLIGFLLFYLVFIFVFFCKSRERFLGLLILIIGWSSSISGGYNSPILFAGTFFVYLLYQPTILKINYSVISKLTLVLLLILIPLYYLFRLNNIYRELPAMNLKYDLGKLAFNFKHIKSNKYMFSYFKDLKKTYIFYSDSNKVAILPSVTGYWLMTKDKNPLKIDWVNNSEHPSKILTNSIIKNLQIDKNLVLFVNKYSIENISQGKVNPRRESIVADYIEHEADLIKTTEYLDVYRFKDKGARIGQGTKMTLYPCNGNGPHW